MKVLTLTQPWATLVAIGAKHIETRSWATSYRGPLAIHAAAGYGKGGRRGHQELCGTEPFCSVLNAACKAHYDALDTSRGVLRAMAESPFMPLGAIVATCELRDCVPTRPAWAQPDWVGEPWFIAFYGNQHWNVPPQHEPERAFGDYTPGRFAWLLADVRPLPTPIPAKGALGLWNYEGAL